MPPALRGEIMIALGLTEPEAGSDVAAAQTRAVRDGDEWVIDGQKMFTTNGAHRRLRVPARPHQPRRAQAQGPHDVPGAAEAPRRRGAGRLHAVGRADEHHLLQRRARPDDALAHRRGRRRLGRADGLAPGRALVRVRPASAAVVEHTEAWAARGRRRRRHAPDRRRRGAPALARAATELEVATLLQRRGAWMEPSGRCVPMAEGPMSKLFSTEALERVTPRTLTEVIGPDALRSRLDPTAPQGGRIEHMLRFSLGTTIYAGTSEVQRNIIAQRACGLPR